MTADESSVPYDVKGLQKLTKEGVLSDRDLRLWGCFCARQQLSIAFLVPSSWVPSGVNRKILADALDVAERYARGDASRDELQIAAAGDVDDVVRATGRALDLAIKTARAAHRWDSGYWHDVVLAGTLADAALAVQAATHGDAWHAAWVSWDAAGSKDIYLYELRRAQDVE